MVIACRGRLPEDPLVPKLLHVVQALCGVAQGIRDHVIQAHDGVLSVLGKPEVAQLFRVLSPNLPWPERARDASSSDDDVVTESY